MTDPTPEGLAAAEAVCSSWYSTPLFAQRNIFLAEIIDRHHAGLREERDRFRELLRLALLDGKGPAGGDSPDGAQGSD